MTRKQRSTKKGGNLRQNPRKPRRNGGSTGAVFRRPPMEPDYPVTYRKKVRWITQSALANLNITYSNLIDQIGVATSATGGYNLFRFLKIHSVEIYDIGATQGSISSCAVTMNENDANLAGGGRMFSDMSFGVTPGYVKAIPSRDALTGGWHVGFGPNTTNAFSITCSAGSVVDIDIEFRGSAAGQVNGEALALVGAIVGATFWRGMDGLPIATSKFVNPLVYQL